MSSAMKRFLRSAICKIRALWSQNLCGQGGRLYYLFGVILALSIPVMIFIHILYYISITLDLIDLHLGSGRCCILMY